MKRISLYSLPALLFLAVPLQAQPDSLWARTYHGRNIDEQPVVLLK